MLLHVIKVLYNLLILKICLTLTYTFIIRKVNSKLVSMYHASLNLPSQGVMVVWKWEWEDDNIDHVSDRRSFSQQPRPRKLQWRLRRNPILMNQGASQCTQLLLNALELHVLWMHRNIWAEHAYYLMKTSNMFQLIYFLNLKIQRITKISSISQLSTTYQYP